jgi:hypothetical protein
VAPGTGPRPGWREQGTAALPGRSRRKKAAVTAAGAAAVAVAGTAASLFILRGGPPSALSVVTGALAGTSAHSYSFSLDNTVELRGQQMNSTMVYGTVDPSRGFGVEALTATSFQPGVTKAQMRFIGGNVYTMASAASGLGKPWNKAPVPPQAGGSRGSDVYRYASDEMISPAELYGVLGRAHVVQDGGAASGAGWVGTKYTFAGPVFGGSISGTVYIDGQGHTRQIDTTVIQGRLVISTDLTLDDFGAQQAVAAPPAEQVKYTSFPYWGRYF